MTGPGLAHSLHGSMLPSARTRQFTEEEIGLEKDSASSVTKPGEARSPCTSTDPRTASALRNAPRPRSAADSALSLLPAAPPQLPSIPRAEAASETTVLGPAPEPAPSVTPSHCPGFLKFTLCLRGKLCSPPEATCMCVCVCSYLGYVSPAVGGGGQIGPFLRLDEPPTCIWSQLP